MAFSPVCRLICLLLPLFTVSFAQQPAYFMLGEDQFRGVQIYDMIQDKDLNYWFATNEGLWHFDYYRYEKIECEKARSNSIFSFVIDREGTIFCHNLNNQVFQITGNECRLFYELKDDESAADISLAVTDNGNLLIGARKIILLDKTGNVLSRNAPGQYYLGPAFTLPDKSILFPMGHYDSVLVFSNNTFSRHPLRVLPGNSADISILKFFNTSEAVYALDLDAKKMYRYDHRTYTLTALPSHRAIAQSGPARIYETGNEIWVAGTLPGVTRISPSVNASDTSVWYHDYFISGVYKDAEGNILLSTFDKGVLVVPDMHIPDVIHSFRDDPVTAIYGGAETGLVLGSSRGKLMHYGNKEQLDVIRDKGTRPISSLYGNAHNDWILFDDESIFAYNSRTGKMADIFTATLKGAVAISENEFYIGTNIGIFRVIWDGKSTFTTSPVESMNYRVYSLEYNPGNGHLYASTARGFFEISPGKSVRKIMYNGEDIFPDDLHANDGKVYAVTEKNGILVIAQGSVTGTIQPVVDGKNESLKKMLIYKNTILANSSGGFFQFDMKGNVLKTIHTMFGFSSARTIDFTIYNDRLWVSHSGGVQQIDLDYIQPNITKPVVRFSEIWVNDQKINFSQPGDFSSNERKIQFILSSPTLRNHGDIRYHYRLSGYDSQWNTSAYESNEIMYNALAPGTYILEVKVENQGLFSEVISYSFSIAHPFYVRWWFIAAAIALFLCIVFMVYRRQLNIHRRKSRQMNELNALKLTAIQSQMNPHFIFNALNSIQDLILKGDVEHSYSYITTFSNLVRRTLKYSEKEFIDFEQEISLLELYLSLEKLRFKKDLDYGIHTGNIEDIMVPPLLIQPFVENALVHGLLHKEGEKKLKITFALKEVLTCTIEDNGIGREQAREIRQRQRSDHESFSGKAIHKRMEVLSNVLKGQFGYTYEDLYENHKPSGTRVILTIPVKRKF